MQTFDAKLKIPILHPIVHMLYCRTVGTMALDTTTLQINYWEVRNLV